MKRFILLLSCFLVLSLAGTSWADVWYVTSDGYDTNNGESWSAPFATIQKAVGAGSVGDEIWVAAGTYVLGESIFVNEALNIYGGFKGTETQLEDRDWVTNVTTVDGRGAVLCFSVTKDATIDGFTITNGYSLLNGGGMRVYRSAPTISNCLFTENSSFYNGGGIQNYLDASPTIINCTFSGNQASWYDGGGIYNFMYSSPTLINCLFHGNRANRNGGGIANYYKSSPTLTNCTFYGNSAGVSGGGIYNYSYASPIITNSILWADTAPTGAELYSYVESYPDISYSDVQGGYLGTGNIDADPNFVDPASGDFHLSINSPSPCIDVGDPSAPFLPETDFEGDPRILFSGPDMGADECIEEADPLAPYVLYAKEKVELERIASSQGDVGSSGKIEIERGRCGTLYGSLHAIGRIKVKGKITVNGDVITNDRIDVRRRGSLKVKGDRKENGELSPIELPELDFNAGGPNVKISKKGDETLAPGSYGKVRVKKRATLYLSSGEYFMDKFDVDRSARVVLNIEDEPIIINVFRRFDIDKRARMQIKDGTTNDVTINVLYDNKIEIDRRVEFQGTLVAPNSKVKLDDRCDLTGAVHSRKISVDKGARFEHHPE